MSKMILWYHVTVDVPDDSEEPLSDAFDEVQRLAESGELLEALDFYDSFFD